ncbi:MAG: DUF1045 domain-containing protein [bacterium]|nr:DUF1045 domain-containing protein [bacterium]
MSSIPCDIVLLPEHSLADKGVAASQKLESFGGLFALEDGKFYPHMSLYMFQLDIDDIAKVEDVLRQIAGKFSVVTSEANKYSLSKGHHEGYIDSEYEASYELHALQDAVVAAINPTRAGMLEKDIAKMEDATGVKLENLQMYGYSSIGELFRPHMTLTRLEGHNPEALNALPEASELSGMFDRLGLFEMGDNGTCVRKLLELPLIPYTIELVNA